MATSTLAPKIKGRDGGISLAEQQPGMGQSASVSNRGHRLDFSRGRAVTASQEAGLIPYSPPIAACLGLVVACAHEVQREVAEYVHARFRDETRPEHAAWKQAFDRYARRVISNWSIVKVVDHTGMAALIRDAGVVTGDDENLDDIVATTLRMNAPGQQWLTEQQFCLWAGLRGTTTA